MIHPFESTILYFHLRNWNISKMTTTSISVFGLLLLAMLATMTAGQGLPLYYGNAFTFRLASSPPANCIRNT
jgi:hypothetical protein